MKNKYKVPKKQWNKWGTGEQRIFNGLFGIMRKNQGMYKHPQDSVRPKEIWETICWNTAWTAANLYEK